MKKYQTKTRDLNPNYKRFPDGKKKMPHFVWADDQMPEKKLQRPPAVYSNKNHLDELLKKFVDEV